MTATGQDAIAQIGIVRLPPSRVLPPRVEFEQVLSALEVPHRPPILAISAERSET